MKKTKGFALIGVLSGIAVAVVIAVAAYFIIDGNNKATDFSKYDFY